MKECVHASSCNGAISENLDIMHVMKWKYQTQAAQHQNETCQIEPTHLKSLWQGIIAWALSRNNRRAPGEEKSNSLRCRVGALSASGGKPELRSITADNYRNTDKKKIIPQIPVSVLIVNNFIVTGIDMDKNRSTCSGHKRKRKKPPKFVHKRFPCAQNIDKYVSMRMYMCPCANIKSALYNYKQPWEPTYSKGYNQNAYLMPRTSFNMKEPKICMIWNPCIKFLV